MKRQFAKQCHGKKAFTWKDKAESFLRKGHSNDRGMNIYRCPWCGLWHLGHASSTKGRKQ